jgi:hypothetical protein
LTWKEIPLPAWAAVLAINSAAAKQYVFMDASVSELVHSRTTLGLAYVAFRDLCHRSGWTGTIISRGCRRAAVLKCDDVPL